MSSRCKPDPEFATELYSQLLDSEPLAGLNPARRDFLAESILPVLFEALPELLQAVQRNEHERPGNEPIDPIRWLGEYLFRHNPRYESRGSSDDPRLRVALHAFARQRIAESKEERK